MKVFISIISLIFFILLARFTYILLVNTEFIETTTRTCDYYGDWALSSVPARCVQYFQGDKL